MLKMNLDLAMTFPFHQYNKHAIHDQPISNIFGFGMLPFTYNHYVSLLGPFHLKVSWGACVCSIFLPTPLRSFRVFFVGGGAARKHWGTCTCIRKCPRPSPREFFLYSFIDSVGKGSSHTMCTRTVESGQFPAADHPLLSFSRGTDNPTPNFSMERPSLLC